MLPAAMTDPRRQPAAGALPSVGFVTLGCAKNLVDSQTMAGFLASGGFPFAPSPEEAEVVVVNTCAFIRAACGESAAAIRAACRLKRRGPCRAVLVAGCLPQRRRERIMAQFPDVDGFVGLDELDRIGEAAAAAAAGERGVFRVSRTARRLFEPARPGLAFTAGPYAYLKIADGCNHRCAFCAIPAIRGRRRSRAVGDIVREAERLLESGFRELNLVAQDVTSYGLDRRDNADLPSLLRALSRIGGRFWIRLLYGFPSRVGDRLLDAMARTPRVCRYFDLPVQHSHPDVLRRMGRASTLRHVRNAPARIRSFLPGVALRTTCLVGFPGESVPRFEHLLDYVREVRFDHLGGFAFSPEEGTPAFRMPGRVPAAEARARLRRLMRTQREIVDRGQAARVGQEAEVLLERRDRGRNNAGGAWIGRSEREAPEVDGQVYVRGVPAERRAGDFARVRYTAAAGYDMLAQYVHG
jgi:ribosomal protein S12 methylthiotransferase